MCRELVLVRELLPAAVALDGCGSCVCGAVLGERALVCEALPTFETRKHLIAAVVGDYLANLLLALLTLRLSLLRVHKNACLHRCHQRCIATAAITTTTITTTVSHHQTFLLHRFTHTASLPAHHSLTTHTPLSRLMCELQARDHSHQRQAILEILCNQKHCR